MTTPERLCGCKRTRADEDGVYDYIDVEEEILRATRRTLCHILVPMIAARMMILDLSRRRHEINSIPNRRQQGASKKQIERIPLKKLKTSPDRSCCICLEDFAAGDEVKTLPCEHYFHSRCIDQWLKINKVCPIDRSSIECNTKNNPILLSD